MVAHDWGQKTAATLLLRDVDVQFRTYDHAYHGLEDEQVRAQLDLVLTV